MFQPLFFSLSPLFLRLLTGSIIRPLLILAGMLIVGGAYYLMYVRTTPIVIAERPLTRAQVAFSYIGLSYLLLCICGGAPFNVALLLWVLVVFLHASFKVETLTAKFKKLANKALPPTTLESSIQELIIGADGSDDDEDDAPFKNDKGGDVEDPSPPPMDPASEDQRAFRRQFAAQMKAKYARPGAIKKTD